jgi:hypothetical protein
VPLSTPPSLSIILENIKNAIDTNLLGADWFYKRLLEIYRYN